MIRPADLPIKNIAFCEQYCIPPGANVLAMDLTVTSLRSPAGTTDTVVGGVENYLQVTNLDKVHTFTAASPSNPALYQ